MAVVVDHWMDCLLMGENCWCMRKASFVLFLAALGLSGCASKSLTPGNISEWPFIATVNEVTIECAAGRPAYAEINGQVYSLNGAAKVRKLTAPFLNHDTGLFLPHPDPAMADMGVMASLASFNKVADSKC